MLGSTYWGRVTHICLSKLTIIGSDNGLSPGWRQAIIWRNAGILLIQTLGTNFSEILSKIRTFSFTKIIFEMSSAKRWKFYLGLNVLSVIDISKMGPRFAALCQFLIDTPVPMVLDSRMQLSKASQKGKRIRESCAQSWK